ncbi:MAG: Tm-1-like ATP-binding domain-containing protein [Verrucomicrobiota bacterium]
MATIAVLGTLDTKGTEHKFVADYIEHLGHKALLIDVGSGKPPKVEPHISRQQVAEIAGIPAGTVYPDQDAAVAAMSEASGKVLLKLLADRKIHGVISIGGERGTAIATAGMRALPMGIPKIMISSLSLGCTSQYVGYRDIIMFPSVADVSGLNRLLRPILSQATGAICGIAEFSANTNPGDKPLVVISTSPQCTAGVDRAAAVIEGAGYEVLRIPSDGAGGHSLESIVDSKLAAGILDMSLRECADETLGGQLSAGPDRLLAAALTGVPAVVVPGCVDMVTVAEDPKALAGLRERTFQKFTDKMRYMRTSPEECVKTGKAIAEKLNLSKGPITVLLPVRGVSSLSSPGKPFHDPEADLALFKSLKSNLRKGITVREMKASINDTPFAEACARALLGNIKASARNKENLRKVEFFEHEPDEFLTEITRMLETEVALPNDYIIKQDDIGDCMYFLAEGAAEVLINGKRIAKLGTGAPFGEMALVSGERRNASIRALEYCEVHRLPKEDFNLLRAKHPAFDERVRGIVKQRIMSNLHT